MKASKSSFLFLLHPSSLPPSSLLLAVKVEDGIVLRLFRRSAPGRFVAVTAILARGVRRRAAARGIGERSRRAGSRRARRPGALTPGPAGAPLRTLRSLQRTRWLSLALLARKVNAEQLLDLIEESRQDDRVRRGGQLVHKAVPERGDFRLEAVVCRSLFEA